MHQAPSAPGAMLRRWRLHRRFSQLALALDAGISTRHLSFLETGRAGASRDTLLQLASRLELPHRERNSLLVAAGFAPAFSEHNLQEPQLASVRGAIQTVLQRLEPNPALVVDRQWHLVDANALVMPLLAGVDAELLRPPINVLRLSLHSQGLASRIENLAEWRAHLLQRLAREVEMTADPQLERLLAELRAYRLREEVPPLPATGAIFVPLRLRTAEGVLSFVSTTTVFGTAADATVAELTIESFLPADEATAQALRRLATTGAPQD